MFGFSRYEMETTGSAERFPLRIEKFRKKKRFFPVLQHYFWWFVHNNITHFLIGIIPIKPFFKFHDWTSVKLNAGEAALTTSFEHLQACKEQAEKLRDTLKLISEDEHSDSFLNVQELIESLEADIEYHENNGIGRDGRKMRKIFRTIFKEK